MIFENLKPQVESIISNTNIDKKDQLLKVCELLETHIDYYNWVGFYFKNGDKEELVLGPYVGAPTDHTVIACSITVKAEIVVPIFVNGENIGQIDIDSNTPDPFTEADERFLEFVNTQVAKLLS